MAEIPSKAELSRELDEVIAEVVEKLHSPVVFAHNDLIMKNIVFNKEDGKYTSQFHKKTCKTGIQICYLLSNDPPQI